MRLRLISLLLSGMLLLSVTACTSVSGTFAAITSNPTSVVASYFTVANSVLRGASPSRLAEVYAPNATLVVSTPAGQTSIFHKLLAIDEWYKALAAGHAGRQLKPGSMRSPLPGMVIHYEIAVDSAGAVKGRCAHIFAVAKGRIVSDDFIVFFGG